MKKTLTSLSALLGLLLLAPSAWSQDVKADPVAGEKKAAMCIGCHGIPGYQASFPQVHKVPMISGQDAKFIASSLTAYAKGDRKHPTMRSIAASLKPQDIADLSAFYEQHGQASASASAAGSSAAGSSTAKAPSAEVAAIVQKGGCVGCHGTDFNKAAVGGAPKVAGQHADYLYVALRSYQTVGNPQIGRNNLLMTGIAKQLTPAELKQVADYLASLPGDLRVVPQSRFR